MANDPTAHKNSGTIYNTEPTSRCNVLIRCFFMIKIYSEIMLVMLNTLLAHNVKIQYLKLD